MNRRQLLGMIAGVACTSVTYAHRDERRMPQPHDDKDCVDLLINKPVSWGTPPVHPTMTARATFNFGAYEDLLWHQHERRAYPFAYDGKRRLMAVTRLSVDVRDGCVICDVYGKLYF